MCVAGSTSAVCPPMVAGELYGEGSEGRCRHLRRVDVRAGHLRLAGDHAAGRERTRTGEYHQRFSAAQHRRLRPCVSVAERGDERQSRRTCSSGDDRPADRGVVCQRRESRAERGESRATASLARVAGAGGGLPDTKDPQPAAAAHHRRSGRCAVYAEAAAAIVPAHGRVRDDAFPRRARDGHPDHGRPRDAYVGL